MSLAYGTTLVAALFLGLNVLFIYAVPLESMKGVVAVGALAAQHLFGPAVGGIFSAAMALSLLATVNAEVTIGPRVYYAMAKNSAFFSMAAKVDPRWHTPVIAILCQGACAILMTVVPFLACCSTSDCCLTFLPSSRWVRYSSFAGARVGKTGRGEFRLSAAARVLRCGGSVDDGSGSDVAPGNFSHRRADGSGRRGRLSLQAAKIQANNDGLKLVGACSSSKSAWPARWNRFFLPMHNPDGTIQFKARYPNRHQTALAHLFFHHSRGHDADARAVRHGFLDHLNIVEMERHVHMT